MPHAGLPRRHTPLGLLVDHPLQHRICRGALAAEPAVLHLGEVALEEVDLVLAGDAGRAGGGAVDVARHAEVVKDLARGDGGRRLRDQLDAAHRLAVPVGRGVEREAHALGRGGVGRVLVAGREGDVLLDGARAVDVVLVGPDLVAPGPVVEVGGCLEADVWRYVSRTPLWLVSFCL